MRILFILGFIFATGTSATRLTFYPQQVIKDKPVTLTCETESSSKNVTYTWLRNGHKIVNLTSSTWTIARASLHTRSTFTCITETKNGSLSEAEVFLNVVAPPRFIDRLRVYNWFLHTATNVSLTCRIECYPLCSILWYKNDKIIDIDNPLYYTKNEILPADDLRNDFESVSSTLVWNLTNWPNQSLNKYDSSSQYTCKSNSTLQDVKQTIQFAIQYPPENITLSTKTVLNVTDKSPFRVTCSAKAYPSATYVWKHTPTGVVEGIGETLYLDKFSRFKKHIYTCEAFNRHGIEITEVYFNVLYKPNCSIELGELDEQEALVCKADGNPRETTFEWKLTSSEEDLEHSIVNKDSESYLILNSTKNNFKNFECHVNNSVGGGNLCTKTLSGTPFQMELSGIAGNIIEGMIILLRCDVEATFMVEITWYNNSVLIESKENKTIATTSTNKTDIITTSSVFRFTVSRWDDHIELKCSASNKFLEKHKIPPLEKTLRLEVLYAPAVTMSSNETTFVEGKNQTAVLFCNYVANPLKPITVTWRKNREVLVRIEGKHTFVTLNNLSLIIANVTGADKGEYRCILSNEVGESTSQNLYLNVLELPTVEITLSSSVPPVSSFRVGNITLSCKVTSGNSSSLSEVYWFVDDYLLEDYITERLYQPQVEKILVSSNSRVVTLEGVGENYLKNFNCQGVNKVGIGPKSTPLEVKIIYPNISTEITQQPETAFKGQKITLECSVKADSFDNVTYVWLKNGYRLRDVHTSKWSIPQTNLELRRNVSCFATSGKRTSIPADFPVKIVAPPSFLSRPKPYFGVLKSSQYVSMSCKVECYPICSIIWTTNGEVITNNSVYEISRKVHTADFLRNDFESVESILTFSRHHIQDDTLYVYSCASVSPTDYGSDVNMSMVLSLEYPPEGLTASETVVDVKENHVPKTVKCKGNGKPLLNYVWKKLSSNEVIELGDTLALGKLLKSDEGNYTCEGYNKHGNQTISVYFHVSHYKPICSIDFGSLGLQQALICSADSDTTDFVFTWKANTSNGSIETLEAFTMNSHSFLIFNETTDFSRSYACLVKNSIGEGKPCETFLPIPPSPAKIKYFPPRVFKKSNVTLECSADDPGFPKNLTYIWFLNRENVYNTSLPTWNISSVSLNDRNSTFSCLVKNQAGLSTQSDQISLNITAPPRFVQTPPSYLSVYYDSKNLSLTCRIECYPVCSIVWLKNGRLLDLEKTKLYYVQNKTYSVDYEEGLFESVESTLVWNLTSWPGNVLNKSEPESKYTCVGSDSANIKSRISFSSRVMIEFGPENLTVSRIITAVVEDEIPDPVECNAEGNPLNYAWINSSSGKVVTESNILQLGKLSKSEGGYYTCRVFNKYGSNSVHVYFNVLYAPTCKVSHDVTTNSLTCSAEGNPPDISYIWEIDPIIGSTIDESNIVNSKERSLLILTDEVGRTDLVDYTCSARNAIGYSQPCNYSNDSNI